MPPNANHAKTKTETTKKNKPLVPRGPYGKKLKQIRYHQFTHNVSIYHFQASFISISTFRSLLKRQEHGYVSTLFSPDPLTNKPVMDGDEMPVECMEVGYLRDFFVAGVQYRVYDREALTIHLPGSRTITRSEKRHHACSASEVNELTYFLKHIRVQRDQWKHTALAVCSVSRTYEVDG
jgi:hypothetical protein